MLKAVRAFVTIATPLIVVAVLMIQGATTSGYDPIRQTISELGTGWGGTRIIGIYGLVVMSLVWEDIAKSLPLTASLAMWIAALLSIGIGCAGLAGFDAESWPWNSMTWQGHLHLIFAFVFVFAAIPAACFFASRALPENWRGLRRYSLACSLGCLVLLIGTLVALRGPHPDPFVSSHLGVIERVYVFSFLIWQCIVSATLRRSPHKDTR